MWEMLETEHLMSEKEQEQEGLKTETVMVKKTVKAETVEEAKEAREVEVSSGAGVKEMVEVMVEGAGWFGLVAVQTGAGPLRLSAAEAEGLASRSLAETFLLSRKYLLLEVGLAMSTWSKLKILRRQDLMTQLQMKADGIAEVIDEDVWIRMGQC
ncbi:hypothetical protein HDU67_000306 [Dinochytrium kinnereticum]|nr:hypothetical protein HDU67_000306 [Dinochytrium kinnereticum]